MFSEFARHQERQDLASGQTFLVFSAFEEYRSEYALQKLP